MRTWDVPVRNSNSKSAILSGVYVPNCTVEVDVNGAHPRESIIVTGTRIRELMAASDSQVDIVVVGSGIGGLTAAVRAARAGARVIVVEKASEAGGTTRLSGGGVWGMRRFEDIRSFVPHGDAELQRRWVEGIPAGHAWLDELGIPAEAKPGTTLSGMDADLPNRLIDGDIIEGYNTIGRVMNPSQFVDMMVEELTRLAVPLFLDTSLEELVRKGGSVVGVVLDAQGTRLSVKTRAVVLATGGFAACPSLIAEHITPYAAKLWPRCVDSVTGDGLRLATQIGAAPSDGGFNAFYGHNLPARPAKFDKSQLIEVSQFYGPAAIAVNLRGERYTDEGETRLEETLAQDTARQPDATALLVFDDVMWKMYRDPRSSFSQAGSDKFGIARDAGAPVLFTHDMEELVRQAGTLGVAPVQLRETIDVFNGAANNGTTHLLDVPKSRYVYPVMTPPFYGVLVQPGITSSMGGLKVNQNAQVLDAVGKTIGGLYACGVDIGNLNNRHYAGNLSIGLVFGMAAADHITHGLDSGGRTA